MARVTSVPEGRKNFSAQDAARHAAKQAAAANKGGRPRKVKVSMTFAERDALVALLDGFVAMIPVQVPDDLPEGLSPEYREIIISNLNSKRNAVVEQVSAVKAQFGA